MSSLVRDTEAITVYHAPPLSSLTVAICTMERVNLGYSKKNIPFANQKNYKIQLIEKIEDPIRRMRWKATFFMSQPGEEEEPIKVENYGLKSLKCPPALKELV